MGLHGALHVPTMVRLYEVLPAGEVEGWRKQAQVSLCPHLHTVQSIRPEREREWFPVRGFTGLMRANPTPPCCLIRPHCYSPQPCQYHRMVTADSLYM